MNLKIARAVRTGAASVALGQRHGPGGRGGGETLNPKP